MLIVPLKNLVAIKKLKKSELSQHLTEKNNEHIIMLVNSLNKLYSFVYKNSESFSNDSAKFRKECREILDKKENDIIVIEDNKKINNNNYILSTNKNNIIGLEDDEDEEKDNDEEEGIELDEDFVDEDGGQIFGEIEKFNKSFSNPISLSNSKKFKFEENKNYMISDINNSKLLDNLKIGFSGLKKKGEKLNDNSYRLSLDKDYEDEFNIKFKLEQRRKEIMKHLRETLKYD